MEFIIKSCEISSIEGTDSLPVNVRRLAAVAPLFCLTVEALLPDGSLQELKGFFSSIGYESLEEYHPVLPPRVFHHDFNGEQLLLDWWTPSCENQRNLTH